MKKNQTKTQNWHPNFQIKATLPDVKVIRTGFIVNFSALCLPIFLGIVFTFNWFKIQELKLEDAKHETWLTESAAENKKNLEKNKAFKDISVLIEDLGRFFGESFDVLELIVVLAETRPKDIAFKALSFSEDFVQISRDKKEPTYKLVIEGVLQGSTSEDFGKLNDYQLKLEKLPIFKDILRSVTLPNHDRDQTNSLFTFKIQVSLNRDIAN